LLVETAIRLDRARFESEVAYIDGAAELATEFEQAGMPVHRLGAGATRLGWAWRLRRLLATGDFAVLHVHSPYVAAIARLLPRPPGLRFLYTEHNEWPAYRPATRWANALTYWRNDRVLAVSDRARRSARRPAGLRFLSAAPIETLYHGVDLAQLRASVAAGSVSRAELGVPDDALVVGTIANFRPEKGHEVLIKAAAKVHDALPGVRFVLVGGGPTEAAVRRQVDALGLTEVVVFAGYREDAPRVAASFDVFVLPSFQEGLPIALIEAMGLGKPVVATKAGGTQEAVEDGVQGLLVPTGDAGALAGALNELLRDPSRRSTMGREAAKRAGDFDLGRAVARLEALYRGAKTMSSGTESGRVEPDPDTWTHPT
jgi:glycosyltransferase involved in cell wall biosynthesis